MREGTYPSGASVVRPRVAIPQVKVLHGPAVGPADRDHGKRREDGGDAAVPILPVTEEQQCQVDAACLAERHGPADARLLRHQLPEERHLANISRQLLRATAHQGSPPDRGASYVGLTWSQVLVS